MHKTFSLASLLIALPLLSWAQSGDPKILIGGGDPPPPESIITGINDVQPCGDATCTYDFTNDTNDIIDSFTFQTMISINDQGDFSCADLSKKGLDPNGYFKNCSVTYQTINVTTDEVVFSYSGINTAPPGVKGGLAGDYEGIAAGGIFHITLDGWTDDNCSGCGDVTLQNSFTTVPEPSAALILFTELLLLAGLAKLVGLRWNRSSRTNAQSE